MNDPAARPGAAAGEELVRLASADNFRDVAGPGLRTADGVPLRAGVLYRSNELGLTDEDAATIAGLGVRAVYDLRDRHEVEAHPDVEVPGAANEHLEVRGIPMDQVASLATVQQADDVMHRVYRGFVEHPGGRAAFAALLGRLADGTEPQLFHCTAGKDRTGWAAALVLHVAGVAWAEIERDYLRTNDRSAGTRRKYLGMVREHLGEELVEVYERVMVADAAYLATAHDAALAAHGSLEGYLREGLGLSTTELDRLRARLV
ncbi:tyrosine-protein phosphatase [Nocardioides nanhaiensis]|uniref:Tyrosine-protein phosphatase n=1 Tax=Nocardioides nanhaiensis TaxID=1476871 RepID=A0ABP8VPJ9_9ACTN